MWTVFFIVMAHADPDRALGRTDESLSERSYVTVDGEGPVTGRWRRRSGDIVGLTFPDGVFERYTRLEDDVPQLTTWYNAAGTPIGALSYVEGMPSTFTMASPVEVTVDVGSWQTRPGPGLALMAPEPARTDSDTLFWSVGSGRIEVGTGPAMDPMDPGFAEQVAQGCACRLIDRHTTWIDGRRGIRLLFELPGAGTDERAELWAIPTEDALVTLWASWLVTDPSPQATLRAIASLATWEDP